MKIPKGIVEDVLVKVDKIYYPVDFVVLDTEPIEIGPNSCANYPGKTIFGHGNGDNQLPKWSLQLTFGNMTLKLNIFHLSNKHKLVEDEKKRSR